MEFSPFNPVIQLCLRGMAAEEQDAATALQLFTEAWDTATNDHEKFLAAYYIARQQRTVADTLHWLETALEHANKVDEVSVSTALPALHTRIADCYSKLGNNEQAEVHQSAATQHRDHPTDTGPFYHGTRADLQVGDLLTPGGSSNYQDDLQMNHIYFTAMVNGAGLAAALARGDAPERVYIIEPTSAFENDPNVTDQKFPGNSTRSYRSLSPLRITGEITEWERPTPEALQHYRNKLNQSSGEIIN